MLKKVRDLMGVGNGFHRKVLDSEQLIIMADLGLLKPFLYDTQNESPTVEEFISIARKSPNFSFECYVTNVGRADERFSIEGILGKDMDIAEYIERFRFADELEFDLADRSFRAWWD